MTAGRAKGAGILAVLVFAVAVPFLFGPYRVGQLTLVLAYAVAVLGLNVLVGYSGQISLGHGAFFALGAYTAATLIEKAGFPHLLTLPVAFVFGLIAGLLFGLPALRVRGLYLALLTLGLAVATAPIIKRFDSLTGGANGLNVVQPAPPGFLSSLDPDQFIYLLTLVIAVPLFVLIALMLRSRVGRALATIRENEIVAKSMGIDIARYKTGAFAISAGYAAVAGALYVFTIGFVAPESFTLVLSISFLAAVVVGGLSTVSGAVLGALFIVLVPEKAADVNDALAGVIYGAVLILVMYIEPGGAVGLARRLWGWAARRRAPTETQLRRSSEGDSTTHAESAEQVAPGADGARGDPGAGRVRAQQ
jgi:branched-chain amino acid transport system permease protein